MRIRAALHQSARHHPQVIGEIGEDDLGEECEAFLAGRYADWLQREGLPVPGWVCVNRAAHLDPGELRRDVHHRKRPGRPRRWHDAEVLIEAAFVAAVPDGQWAEIRRAVLVPLELELMGRTVSPRGALERVCQALY